MTHELWLHFHYCILQGHITVSYREVLPLLTEAVVSNGINASGSSNVKEWLDFNVNDKNIWHLG